MVTCWTDGGCLCSTIVAVTMGVRLVVGPIGLIEVGTVSALKRGILAGGPTLEGIDLVAPGMPDWRTGVMG